MKRTRVKQLLSDGRVLVNDEPATRHDHPLFPGDRIAIARTGYAPNGPGQIHLPIVFEDEAIIVVDKPAGLLTVATETEKTETAYARLHQILHVRRAGRPFVVHRLDRDTSGLLLFARSLEVKDKLQASWDRVKKTYLAVTEGSPRPTEGVVENFLVEGKSLRVHANQTDSPGAKKAVTRYRVVAARFDLALVEVELETGRKHQIRVHMAGLGCPIVGDENYGAKSDPADRLGLHAWKLEFDHPVTGELLKFESPLPPPLRRLVGRSQH